ncbi:MAG TPA: DUF6438 domain-containing protein [Niabella sp.]
MKTTSNIVRSFVFRYKLLRALTCLIIISCTDNRQHTTKKVLRATEQKPEYQLDSISLQTGACEGTCPVYALTLFANNTARFEGGAFCTRTGVYKAGLSGGLFDSIACFVDRNKMYTLKEEYNNGTVDVQSATLAIYYKNRPAKTITDMQMAGTPALTALYEQLQKIADSAGWVKE